MASFKEDTAQVKAEFEGLSNSTQIFVWSMVGLGVIIGLLLGGAIAYGVVVDEVDGRDCIEYEGDFYCADGAAADEADDAEADAEADDDTDG